MGRFINTSKLLLVFSKTPQRGVFENNVKSLEILTRRPTFFVLPYFGLPTIQKPVFYPIYLVPLQRTKLLFTEHRKQFLFVAYRNSTPIVFETPGSVSFCINKPKTQRFSGENILPFVEMGEKVGKHFAFVELGENIFLVSC